MLLLIVIKDEKPGVDRPGWSPISAKWVSIKTDPSQQFSWLQTVLSFCIHGKFPSKAWVTELLLCLWTAGCQLLSVNLILPPLLWSESFSSPPAQIPNVLPRAAAVFHSLQGVPTQPSHSLYMIQTIINLNLSHQIRLWLKYKTIFLLLLQNKWS